MKLAIRRVRGGALAALLALLLGLLACWSLSDQGPAEAAPAESLPAKVLHPSPPPLADASAEESQQARENALDVELRALGGASPAPSASDGRADGS